MSGGHGKHWMTSFYDSLGETNRRAATRSLFLVASKTRLSSQHPLPPLQQANSRFEHQGKKKKTLFTLPGRHWLEG